MKRLLEKRKKVTVKIIITNYTKGSRSNLWILHNTRIEYKKTNNFLLSKYSKRNILNFFSNEISILSILNDQDNIIKLIGYGKGFLTLTTNSNNNAYSDRQIFYYQVLEYSNIGELKDYVNGTLSKIQKKFGQFI